MFFLLTSFLVRDLNRHGSRRRAPSERYRSPSQACIPRKPATDQGDKRVARLTAGWGSAPRAQFG
jgi:hypothetical protein